MKGYLVSAMAVVRVSEEAMEVIARRSDIDLLAGKFAEQGMQLPGSEVPVTGAENADLGDLILIIEVE